ncbi:ABC transporter substrate-binding protein [Roseomonas sp. GC11]|uniref:ABC transporter substrate-binding protein n=1 Tax=Roseomonas sp. GC11 TaxID=2950546 RepID=UPI00210A7EE4|nr:ABC transporter substrate-binding protein [Roseomonas sp. GC11]MCQ4161868.1 ABC transporter substrate-binding protein [Roseomonas sp. GC11]
MSLTRRSVLLAAGAAALPRFAIAQADTRPSLTIAVQKLSTSGTLDILREASNVGTRWYNLFSEPLIETAWTGDLSARPGLATAWRRIDERRLELELREGVRFQDGRPMTVEDVAFTFGAERMWGGEGIPAAAAPPPEVVASARGIFGGLERIEIVNARTLRWVHRQGDLTLEGRLAHRGGCILPRHAWEAAGGWRGFFARPTGTGPYRVVEWQLDRQLVLEAFDGYWGGRPPVKRLRFVEVPELASRLNGLFAGEYDFACDIPPDQIPLVERNPRFTVMGGPILNHRVTHLDASHPVLANPLVRRALTHAVDRQAIVDSLWAGRTVVPPGLQFPFFGPMLRQGWAVPAYDPAEARRLLREAGYRGEPIPYRMLPGYYTAQAATGQIQAEMWRAAGLNVEIQMMENWSQVLARGPGRGLYEHSVSAFFNDPVSYVADVYGPQGTQQRGGFWRNAEFDTLLPVLETATDMARRARAWARMLEILEREDPAVHILHQTANFTALRRGLRWRPAQSFVMDFRAGNFALAE